MTEFFVSNDCLIKILVNEERKKSLKPIFLYNQLIDLLKSYFFCSLKSFLDLKIENNIYNENEDVLIYVMANGLLYCCSSKIF